MQNILYNLQRELQSNAEKKYRQGSLRFFKEPVRLFGVRTPKVRKLAHMYFKKIQQRPKKEILKSCEKLLQTEINENTTVAFAWALKLRSRYKPSDFKTFDRWLKKYVSNWGMCDDFCTHAFGELIYLYPRLESKVKKYTDSRDRWLRRASAVIYIYLIRKKNCLKDIFAICDRLLTDEDDMVQKGYGWLLKEASNIYPHEVFKYVMSKKNNMPRTALRYAIEKMPVSRKQKAMR